MICHIKNVYQGGIELNIKQLRYFYEIANEGQITRAAKKLHIAQPPLSQSLRALEESLDVKLFERQQRQMVLTEAGKVLYNKAELIFYNIDETKIEVKETNDGIRGILTVGCNKSCFSHIPKKIKLYQDKYPNVRFKLLEGDSYFLTKKLEEREIEVAVVRLPINKTKFNTQPLPIEQYVAVVSNNWINEDHKDTITIEELANIPLVLLHRIHGQGQYEIVLNQFTEAGLSPNIICESHNVDMVLGLISEGLGATIVPESTLLKNDQKNVKVLRLENIKIISESAVVWLKDRYLAKSTEKFIELFDTNETLTKL